MFGYFYFKLQSYQRDILHYSLIYILTAIPAYSFSDSDFTYRIYDQCDALLCIQ